MRTRVKICGITRVEDALSAAQLGCDAIGLVFYEHSPRHVSIERAAEMVRQLPPFVSAVGLFVDAAPELIYRVLTSVRLDLLQFHGSETPEQCRTYGLPYMKAIRVRPDINLLQYAQTYIEAKALLLDTYSEKAVGGTGQVFDWQLIPDELPQPIVLAGGLNADNVKAAIERVRPFAVDVSGGVETAKGIKDAAKMAAFMRGVRNASL